MIPETISAMLTPHQPPFTITPRILGQVAECCEYVGSWRGGQGGALSPQLRRENRIRSIQASLAIENNSLRIDQVSDQVKSLLNAFHRDTELSSEELLKTLGLSHKPTFRKNYLNPALAAALVEMTQPEAPRSPTQRYCLTQSAQRFLRN
jgi:hypothetical protein